MIKKQKKLFYVMGAAFLVLLILYFAVIRPLTAEVEENVAPKELLEWEAKYNDLVETFYIFEPLDRASIQQIKVENEHGGYTIYRDASDTFQLKGFVGLQFDQELFSSLVVTTGTPTVMMRVAVDATAEQLAEFGLDTPQASWTVTSTSGEDFTVQVGDLAITEGGYYVYYEPDASKGYSNKNAIYFMGPTLADTILKPDHELISPILTAGMSQNNYFFVDEFTVWHGEELFVHIERIPEDQMADPNSIVEVDMTYPRQDENTKYQVNDNLYYEILYNFMTLQGDSILAFQPTEEQLEEFGLAEPAYMIDYVFEDYEFVLFVSEQQADGTYNAVSNLYGYELVCKVSKDMLGWLEYDKFDWIFPTPFYENIVDITRITLNGSGIDVDYQLKHGTTGENTPTLEVTEVKSGTFIPNEDVRNFREYYKTMLNITNQEYARMSEEDIADLTHNEDKRILTMTYEKTDGTSYEFRFYKHYEASTDTTTTGKIFVVVNDIGEFYTTNDLINKIINDTSRVLQGLDVEAYNQY
ncbi:MAG: DUF4340 domain-containing protein [Clostridia bacterium]|nr:DUF4340 domain-containing protein [Clostridia bacterium]